MRTRLTARRAATPRTATRRTTARRTAAGRPVPRRGLTAARIAGYAGTTLLVAAAVLVLLMPLLDDGKGAGAQGSPDPASASPGLPQGAPGDPVLPGAPTGPQGGQSGGATGPGGQGGAGRPAPGPGGGPPIPEQGGGGGITWCPKGTASYRAAPTGVDVVITAASSGAVRAEMSLRGGGAPQSQQATVTGRRPHTFHFRGVAPGLVERVKITTVSVGVSMQTCYARAA